MNGLRQQTGRAQILLVDDDVDTLWLLARACQVAGWDTTQVCTGREALEELEKNFYHVALLDLKLPDMNGIEILREIHKRDSDLYVIIFTACASLDSAVTALRLGATDYIEKPVVARDVLEAIRCALEERSKDCRRMVELLGLGDQMIGPGAGNKQSASPGDSQRFETSNGIMVFEPKKQQVMLNGRLVSLTPGETDVLGVLLENLDQPLSPQDIAVDAWGETMEAVSAESVIRPHIHRLRQKLDGDGSAPRAIATVRGRGYVIYSN